MILTSARVTNFKSVEDSTEFRVDRMTCLVGKNESGKTSLLQALLRLNPSDKEKVFDKDTEYPRRYVNDYDTRHQEGPAAAIATRWKIEDSEKAKISAALGDGVLLSEDIGVSRGYDNKTIWSIEVSEEIALSNLVKFANIPDEEKEPFSQAKTVDELRAVFTKIPPATESQQRLNKALVDKFKSGTARDAVLTTIELPVFVYFGNYDRMGGRVSVTQLQNNSMTDKREQAIAQAFFDLAGLKVADVASAQKIEPLISKLESVSNNISRQIFKYWSQNRHLKVRIQLQDGLAQDLPPYNSGKVLHTRIENTHHEATVGFDDRSTGFVWFFSFLVYFSQLQKKFADKQLVLLLDEPGLTLHAKAQSDLLRYFKEQLLPKHQLIYTTHSPFMVPPDLLACVRTVEDVVIDRQDEQIEVLGTKVGCDVLSIDRDTIFPLQGALGYDITQSLFIGHHCLVVEGPADLLYIDAFTRRLNAAGRKGLDRRWTVVPARGIDHIAAFVVLVGGQKLNVAVLTDFAKGVKAKVDKIRAGLLSGGGVFTADTYAKKAEADVEDIVGSALFCHLVNTTYQLTGSAAVTPPQAADRVMPYIERMMAANSTSGLPAFDHYAPAEYLVRNPAVLDGAPGLAEALNRFEVLFADINARLPTP